MSAYHHPRAARILVDFGHHHILKDPKTGHLFVDDEQLDADAFGGEARFSGEDDFEGDDDFDGDDDFEGDDDDFDGDDDDFDGDDDDDDEDFGASKRRVRRLNRRLNRIEKREARVRSKLAKARRSSGIRRRGARMKGSWVGTALGGSVAPTGAGAANITIRTQHDFEAEDVRFTCSSGTYTVTTIFFGAVPVWSNASGITHDFFGATSTMTKILQGMRIRAGLDIQILGTATAAATINAMITGTKPADTSCR